MNTAPIIEESTEKERRDYIKNRFPCLSDCDMCGLCKVFHGKDPENAFDDYIKGNRSFLDVSADYKQDNVGRVFNKAGKIFAGPVTMVEIDSKHLPSDETMVDVCKRTIEFFENT